MNAATLLEYVCEQLMGPPVSRSCGRAVWRCPRHEDNHPSFNTLPPKDGCKDRFRCWSCGFWGDVHDLLIEFRPELKGQYPERCRILAEMKADWKRQVSREAAVQPHLHRGDGDRKPSSRDDRVAQMNAGTAHFEFEKVLTEWEANKAMALQTLKEFKRICDVNHTTMEEALQSWLDFDEWVFDSELRHYAGCMEEDCDWPICVAERNGEW